MYRENIEKSIHREHLKNKSRICREYLKNMPRICGEDIRNISSQVKCLALEAARGLPVSACISYTGPDLTPVRFYILTKLLSYSTAQEAITYAVGNTLSRKHVSRCCLDQSLPMCTPLDQGFQVLLPTSHPQGIRQYFCNPLFPRAPNPADVSRRCGLHRARCEGNRLQYVVWVCAQYLAQKN